MSSHTEQSRLHSLSARAVRRMRLARSIGVLATLVGVGLFLLFLIQSGFFSLLTTQTQTADTPRAASQQISSVDTVINGFDKDGLPFTITAVSAIQDKDDTKLAHLVDPHGVFARASGKSIELTSKSGAYHSETKLLNLEGEVVFEQQGSYKAHMEKAELNLDSFSLSSKSAVQVELNTGSVSADHLEISDNGKKTVFSGHVKANLKTDIESGILQ